MPVVPTSSATSATPDLCEDRSLVMASAAAALSGRTIPAFG